MNYGNPDRVPRFDEGIREDVVSLWHTQGLPKDKTLSQVFSYDGRREIIVDLEPQPKLKGLPRTEEELNAFRNSLDPNDPKRYSKNWSQFVETCKKSDHTLMLRVHSGFFLTLGVHAWSGFMDVMNLILDHPDKIRGIMMAQGEFAAQITENILQQIDVDAVLFSEPIGGNDKPLISPAMYEDFVLASYEPVLNLLKQYEVNTIIFRTYGNSRVLIPSVLKWGFNCVWACESNLKDMDYRALRREFGRDMRLIGGIDLDILRKDKAAIRKEVEEKIPPLLADGGYIPLADGRVRQDVPYENYVFYRDLLTEITAP